MCMAQSRDTEAAPRKKVTLDINGQAIHLWTDSSPERIEAVGKMVSTLVEEISLQTKTPASQKTVLMALIKLADQHLDLQGRYDSLRAEAAAAATEAVAALDTALKGRT